MGYNSPLSTGWGPGAQCRDVCGSTYWCCWPFRPQPLPIPAGWTGTAAIPTAVPGSTTATVGRHRRLPRRWPRPLCQRLRHPPAGAPMAAMPTARPHGRPERHRCAVASRGMAPTLIAMVTVWPASPGAGADAGCCGKLSPARAGPAAASVPAGWVPAARWRRHGPGQRPVSRPAGCCRHRRFSGWRAGGPGHWARPGR